MPATLTPPRTGFFRKIVYAASFLIIFVFHTYPHGLSDFWWHLNTARWIWENGRLPIDDPFLFTSPSPLDDRASLILRGYPLAQLLMLAVYNLGGFHGLLLLKGSLMTVFYALLWNNLRRGGLHPVLGLAVVLALPLLFYRFDELRPQVFSFIGTLAVWHWAEQLLELERRGRKPPLRLLAALPLTLLLWSNLHRGFIIGMGMVLSYLLFEWFGRRRQGAPSGPAFKRFALVVLASLLATCFNPNGWTAVWASFSETAGPFSQVIDEFWATPRYFELHGARLAGYGVLSLALLPVLALAYGWRKIEPAHGFMALVFLFAGLMSFRFSLMMVAMVLVITARYYGKTINHWLAPGWRAPLLWLVIALPMAGYASQRTGLTGTALEQALIPEGAVNYLATHPVQGNIFNPFEYGGYLSWRLYPRKIFMDQRNLSWETYEEYTEAWRGNYQNVFQKYGIGAVIHPAVSGRSRLIPRLMQDPLWQVAYYDGSRLVMVRVDINGHLPLQDKSQVMQHILGRMAAR